jgi:hypothetical protein
MAFVPTESKVGKWVHTTKEHESCSGKFEVGSYVKVTGIGDRGYEIEDKNGNRMIEIGWEI